jgi:4-amino-4-deoxy-L-arabinose transferase-like glycosyltransferase
MKNNKVDVIHLGLVTLTGLIFFLPFLGFVPLFDWDEINFAESAREMIVTGNYSRVTINYEPFWEKPPLFFWLQVLSMKLFGVGEFAARFPNALFGVFTLCFIFIIGSKHHSSRFGMYWVMIYLGSFLPHFYFKTGLIDPVFNFFIFSGIYAMYLASITKKFSYYLGWAGLAIGLAILTKGPVALLISGLTGVVFSLFNRKLFYIPFFSWIKFLFIALTVSSVWFLPEVIKNGTWFLNEFFEYQLALLSQDVAGHQQPFYYHTLVLLIGCFPASVLFFSAFRKGMSEPLNEKILKLWMKVLFFVVLILFSVVKTKIIHYSSMCWLPLTYLATVALDKLYTKKTRFMHWQKALMLLLGSIWAIIFIAIPLMGANEAIKAFITENIKDVFVVGNLNAPVDWLGWEWIVSVLFLLGMILVFVWMFKQKIMKAMHLLFSMIAIFISVISVLVVPNVEKHLQGTVIDFYKTKAGEDVYLKPTEKSYAVYFYAKATVPDSNSGWERAKNAFLEEKAWEVPLSAQQRNELNQMEWEWLLEGKIDKPVYFIAKLNRLKGLDTHPNVSEVLNQGGYSIFVRKPQR